VTPRNAGFVTRSSAWPAGPDCCLVLVGAVSLSNSRSTRATPSALNEQVAAEVRRAIADEEASPGDRLPPARYLAAVLGVNHNTVIRALHTR
jgi:Bacterial regulatory proteins, gntR family